ncbi:MAG: folylpolyglutamate synthase/dihydrofolate synthase family protein [Candidatus Omnitrophota bacterium]
MMSYPEAVAYLESFVNYEKIPWYPYKRSVKLKRIRDFLASIGNPHHALRCVHVAGTKGKGSTSACIAFMLRAGGYRVGLYTSPHLSDFRERIRVLSARTPQEPLGHAFEGMITKDALARLLSQLKPAIERYRRVSKYGALSFFEVYTSLAFLYFKERKVDIAVLETGLGGRLDATNVVDPLVCALTPISYEHTRQLGNTLEKIAKEKAGIVKSPGVIVISAPQSKDSGRVIRERCARVGAHLFTVGKDIRLKRTGMLFSVQGLFSKYPNLKIKLLGSHQRINAAVAIGVVEGLRYANIRIDNRSIRKGLSCTFWPGRCEVVARAPLVILDGAQNKASALALKKAIRENFRYKDLILVLGISQDKDIQGVCSALRNLADTVILTKACTIRASEPQQLYGYFAGKRRFLTADTKSARLLAEAVAGKNDLVLVTGSFFVIGEFRRCFFDTDTHLRRNSVSAS